MSVVNTDKLYVEKLQKKGRMHKDCLEKLAHYAFQANMPDLLYDLAMDDKFICKQCEVFGNDHVYQTFKWAIELQDSPSQNGRDLLDKLENFAYETSKHSFFENYHDIDTVLDKINTFPPEKFFKALLYLIWLESQKHLCQEKVDYIICNIRVKFEPQGLLVQQSFFMWWAKNIYRKISLGSILKMLKHVDCEDFFLSGLVDMFLEEGETDLAYQAMVKMSGGRYNKLAIKICEILWEKKDCDKVRYLLDRIVASYHDMVPICKFHALLGQHSKIHELIASTNNEYWKFKIYLGLTDVAQNEEEFRSWARKAFSELEHQLQEQQSSSWQVIIRVLQNAITNIDRLEKFQLDNVLLLCRKLNPYHCIQTNLGRIIEWLVEIGDIEAAMVTNEHWKEAYSFQEIYTYALKNNDEQLAQRSLNHVKKIARDKAKEDQYCCAWIPILKALHCNHRENEIRKILKEENDVVYHCLKNEGPQPLFDIPQIQDKIWQILHNSDLDAERKSYIFCEMAKKDDQQTDVLLEKSFAHAKKICDAEFKYYQFHTLINVALEKNYIGFAREIIDVFQKERSRYVAVYQLMKKFFMIGELQKGLELYAQVMKSSNPSYVDLILGKSPHYAYFPNVPNEDVILSFVLRTMNLEDADVSSLYKHIVNVLLQYHLYEQAFILVPQLKHPIDKAQTLIEILSSRITTYERSQNLKLIRNVEDLQTQITDSFDYLDVGIQLCSLRIKMGDLNIEEMFKSLCQRLSNTDFNTDVKFSDGYLVFEITKKFITVAEKIDLATYFQTTMKNRREIVRALIEYKVEVLLDQQSLTADDIEFLSKYILDSEVPSSHHYRKKIDELLQQQAFTHVVDALRKSDDLYIPYTLPKDSSTTQDNIDNLIKTSLENFSPCGDIAHRLESMGYTKNDIAKLLEEYSKSIELDTDTLQQLTLNFVALGNIEKVKEFMITWERDLLSLSQNYDYVVDQKKSFVFKIVSTMAETVGEIAISFIEENCSENVPELMTEALSCIFQKQDCEVDKKYRLAKKYIHSYPCTELLLFLVQSGEEIHPGGDLTKLPDLFVENQNEVYQQLSYFAAQRQKIQQVSTYVQNIYDDKVRIKTLEQLAGIFCEQQNFEAFPQVLQKQNVRTQCNQQLLRKWLEIILNNSPQPARHIKQCLLVLHCDEQALILLVWMLRVAILSDFFHDS